MNHGPLIFLGSFLALASSWFGLILMPQLQIGRQQAVVIPETGQFYPATRPGLAAQGAQVYRANGCYYCHSQQVRQSGTLFDVTLAVLPKTETPEAGEALAKKVLLAVLEAKAGISAKAAKALIKSAPKPLLSKVPQEEAENARNLVVRAGGKAEIDAQPTGADIERNWGRRRTVAADYLYDYPVMLGAQRIGPDLANVGARLTERKWHLMHLYRPNPTVGGSTMPPYPHLFEKRKKGRTPSPDALKVPPYWLEKDMELVPKPEATALVAYLMSLKAEASLFEAQTPKLPPSDLSPSADPSVGGATSPAR